MATGIRKRSIGGKTVYEINFYDQHRVRRYEPAGTTLRAAKRLRDKRLAEVKAGTYVHGGPNPRMLMDELADYWTAEKEREGMRSLDDARACYDNHVRPRLGRVRVEDLTPKMVDAMVRDLRGELAAKTIRNVHGVLRSMLELARFEEVIVTNPATLPRGKLPRVAKKRKPRFSREELWQLLTDPAIPGWRRVFYALMGLGGLRLGEASGRRWRDYDTDTSNLGALLVHSQYDDQPLKTADDGEDTRERLVPVHPALADILERWRREGFAELYGRHPSPDDWLCPDPRTGKPRTQNQAVKALYRDLERVGIAHREPGAKKGRACHAFRHTFISLARSDGARKDVLERVTHNARGDVVDGYTDWEWTALSEAVGSLRLGLERAPVVELEAAREATGGQPLPPPPAAHGGGNGGGGAIDPGISSGGGGSRTLGRIVPTLVSPEVSPIQVRAGNPQKRQESAKPVSMVATRHHLERARTLLEDAGHSREAKAVRWATEELLEGEDGER